MKHCKLVLFCCLVLAALISCSKTDDHTNRVTYIVESNNSDVPIRVVGADPRSTYIVVKGHYENTITTDVDVVSMVANCDDPNALITLEIRVNGKRKDRVSGNGRITTKPIYLRKND